MAGIFSVEWLNANMSKAYPFDDTVGGSPEALPSDLLVDGLIISESPNIASAFVSNVFVGDTGWGLGITVTYRESATETVEVIFNKLIYVPFNAQQFTAVDFDNTVDGYHISGSFTIGNADSIANWPADSSLTSESGELSPAIIHALSGDFIRGIQVGDVTLTGEIELVAGDGIELVVDQDTNSIKIVNTKYQLNDSTDLKITGDKELLAAITSQYGTPIRTICGVLPDDGGNIDIKVPTDLDGSTFVSVERVNSDAGTIVLGLDPNPKLYMSDIEVVVDNLAALNDRASILDAGIKSLDSAINRLATQMTRLA